MINNNTRKPVLFYLMKFLVLFIIFSSGNEVDRNCDIHLFLVVDFPKYLRKPSSVVFTNCNSQVIEEHRFMHTKAGFSSTKGLQISER